MSKTFSVNKQEINNFHGDLDILIGMSNYSLFPVTMCKKGNLGLLKSDFGKPYLVVGSPKGSQGTADVKCNFIQLRENFWEYDGLGLNEDPKCESGVF